MRELLDYMKAVLEGKEGLLPFARWFADNEESLRGHFNQGTFLRMKSEPLLEFARVLKANDVTYEPNEKAYLPHGPGDFSWIKPSWLLNRVFPYQQSPTSLAHANVAYMDEFLHMIEVKQSGDEMWRFSSPKEDWRKMIGRAGIALVRDKTVVYAIVTMMN